MSDPYLPEGCCVRDISPEEPAMESREVFFSARADFTNQTVDKRLTVSRWAAIEMGWSVSLEWSRDEEFSNDECKVEHYVELTLPECADDQEIETAILDKLAEKAQRYGFELSDVEVML